jgi:hypothetical protein
MPDPKKIYDSIPMRNASIDRIKKAPLFKATSDDSLNQYLYKKTGMNKGLNDRSVKNVGKLDVSNFKMKKSPAYKAVKKFSAAKLAARKEEARRDSLYRNRLNN